jgi:triphosphoribosyl-dephospho-CoA synthetase
MDITTRGIMAQKGFIELDEVDLGWIVAEAAKELQIWQNKKKCYIGVLSLISPLAAAAGYLFSENANDLEYEIDFADLKRLTLDFLDNTTPEDTVHIFSRLYTAESDNFQKIKDYSSTLSDGQEMILADEINLIDFYKMFSKEILAFKEISNNYEFIFGNGKNAFFGGLDEGLPFIDSISNTYLHMLALDQGGLMSKKGRDIAFEMERKYLEHNSTVQLRGISDITTAVTFLATLTGLRP